MRNSLASSCTRQKALLGCALFFVLFRSASSENPADVTGSVANDLFFSVTRPELLQSPPGFTNLGGDVNLWQEAQQTDPNAENTQTRSLDHDHTQQVDTASNPTVHASDDNNLQYVSVHDSDSDSDSDNEGSKPKSSHIRLVECQHCRSTNQCFPGLKCWANRCVLNTPATRNRCFTAPPRAECHSCQNQHQCAIGLRCWQGKCVQKVWVLQYRCFRNIPDCAPCSSSWQCANRSCYRYHGRPSRCARHKSHYRYCHLGDECAGCRYRSHCKSGYCHNRQKCVNLEWHAGRRRPSHASIIKCFPPPRVGQCGVCRSNHNCKPGLVCKVLQHGHPAKCAKLMGPGGSCRDPCWACAHGLHCKDKRCVRGHCGQCTSDQHCENGMVCRKLRPSDPWGKCAKVMGPGGSCKDPCWACGHGTHCKNDRCVYGHCGKCTSNHHCENGMVCRKLRPSDPWGKCAKVMRPGGSCKDPCWACGQGTQCKNDRCVYGHCGKCTNNHHCENGMICRKLKPSDPWGKCAKVVSPGGNCADPCWSCPHGTECQNGKCRGGECHACKNNDFCQHGFTCKKAHPSHQWGKCARVVKPGNSCKDGCKTCGEGHECQHGVCVAGLCKACGKNAPCQKGLVCNAGKCAQVGRIFSKCDGHCNICDQHTTCENGKCVGKLCYPCLIGSHCANGLICKPKEPRHSVGNLVLGRCTKVVDANQPCDHFCTTCKHGLNCEGGKVCKAKGDKCDRCKADNDCKHRLVCERKYRTDPWGKCTEFVGKEDDKCDKKTCTACKGRLECRHNLCRPIVDKCGTCRFDDDCHRGLFCHMTGKSDDKGKLGICKELKKLGEDCRDGCSHCEGHLFCRNKRVCKPPREDECGKCTENDDCKNDRGLFCKFSGEKDKNGNKIGTCTTRVKRDGSCKDGCKECEAGLFCRNKTRCTPPREGECGKCRENDDCMPGKGLYCKFNGKTDAKGKIGVCTTVKKQTEKCNDTKGCHECEKGTTCRKNKCRPPRRDKCGSCRDDEDCMEGKGLHCKHKGIADSLGKVGECFAQLEEGDKCVGEKCGECKKGTTCRKGICRGPRVRFCGRCRDNEDCPEKEGVHCSKEVGHKFGKCVMTSKRWKPCNDDCWVCERGLICRPSKTGGKVCGPPGEKCDFCSTKRDCKGDLICKYWNGVGKCAERMGVGHKCSDHCWACEKGLRCVDGICKRW